MSTSAALPSLLTTRRPTSRPAPVPPAPETRAETPNGRSQKCRPEPQVGVGRAVLIGVKDATAPVYNLLDLIGGHLILVAKALVWLPRRPFRGQNYLEAAEYIGFGSLPVVLLVGLSTGMVMSLQSVNGIPRSSASSRSAVAAPPARRSRSSLGPVLTSLILAGRAGAGIATELGIDADHRTDRSRSSRWPSTRMHRTFVLPRLIGAIARHPDHGRSCSS